MLYNLQFTLPGKHDLPQTVSAEVQGQPILLIVVGMAYSSLVEYDEEKDETSFFLRGDTKNGRIAPPDAVRCFYPCKGSVFAKKWSLANDDPENMTGFLEGKA